ncbi:MAG: GH3 auxin-responsive promoter family protein, partial [Bacteroidetes bacterium]|nr:GH3 auxin-responsive promoter family protein [Bacteroidota bacterium]
MPIIPSIVNWLYTKRLNQIDLFRKYPFETQEEVLFKLLAKASQTEAGRRFDFNSVETVETFRKRVPLQTYEQFAPTLQRMRNGESNLTWPGDIRWFAKSSGTTDSKSKFIPVSREALEECHFRGGKDMLAIYFSLYPDTGIFSGKGLTLGGSHRVNNFSNDSLYGDLSAILIQNAPFWVDIIRTPKAEIALIEDFELKMEMITGATINENVTSISGVPSWNLVLLRHILNHTGRSNILELWPDLEVFFHGGISFEPYRAVYRELIPSGNMRYMESYNASEGFFGLQDDPGSSDMLLMLDYGVFFEFIPADMAGDENPVALHIGEVKTGDNYAIVISTNGGLWRYIIGDTITFTSLYPHKFRITGRTKHFINAFGEEVIIDNAEKALMSACRATGSVVAEYTAGPVYMDSSAKGS